MFRGFAKKVRNKDKEPKASTGSSTADVQGQQLMDQGVESEAFSSEAPEPRSLEPRPLNPVAEAEDPIIE